MIPPPDHPLSAPPAEKRDQRQQRCVPILGEDFPPLKRGFGLALQVTLNFDCRRERALSLLPSSPGTS